MTFRNLCQDIGLSPPTVRVSPTIFLTHRILVRETSAKNNPTTTNANRPPPPPLSRPSISTVTRYIHEFQPWLITPNTWASQLSVVLGERETDILWVVVELLANDYMIGPRWGCRYDSLGFGMSGGVVDLYWREHFGQQQRRRRAEPSASSHTAVSTSTSSVSPYSSLYTTSALTN